MGRETQFLHTPTSSASPNCEHYTEQYSRTWYLEQELYDLEIVRYDVISMTNDTGEG